MAVMIYKNKTGDKIQEAWVKAESGEGKYEIRIMVKKDNEPYELLETRKIENDLGMMNFNDEIGRYFSNKVQETLAL